ncbi:dihydropyrimidinase [Kineosporia succinea]|uniref:Dihydropyrimidinase n=1 Tax=Kineosporia succinea TaxID=84632 RepID=A0ABT9PAQ8_9ACTN|nr:dihydropyrimidinase [Kineosporia succinea]MDP9829768.1 dihydropyrimidinase [Kineosporia succinea]
MSDLVVRGGTLVQPDWSGPADLHLADGVVRAVVAPGTPLPAGAEVLDATGRLVMPGGVDPHCHVGFTSGGYTSLDGYAECTTAAVLGGTTTIVDFAIPQPGQRPVDVAAAQRAKVPQGLCDAAVHASVVEWDDTTADQLRSLVADGLATVKMFTTYRGESMASADTILKTMQVLKESGGMVVIHCEANPIIEEDQRRAAERGEIDAAHMAGTRSELAETAAVAEVLAIAETLDAPVYFVHQSTPAAVELVAAARRRGLRAYTESVAHHLVLDDSLYDGPNPERWVCCPPLRDRATVEALGGYLANGEITTVASDHCCYDTAQKVSHRHDVRHMPNGLPGVQTRLPVIFSTYVATGRITPSRFVELTAANPARTNGIYPRKGTLAPGSDADLVLWDPSARWTITAGDLAQATDYTPYEGIEVTGRPETVVVGGRVIAGGGRILDATPRGRFLPASLA